MRTKTRAARPRFSKSPQKPPSSAASVSAAAATTTNLRPLPFLNLDDDVDSVVQKTSSESDDDDSMDVDLVEGNSCIKCRSGQEELLVCSEIGCPVAIHEKCYQFKPRFDELGKFYCPCCWYKRDLARTDELRKKSMLTKKVLLDFMASKVVGDVGKENQDDENVSSLVGERNCTEHLDAMEFVDEIQNRVVQGGGSHQNDEDSAKQADCDQHRLRVEHQVDSFPAVVGRSDDAHHCQEENSGIDSFEDSTSKENVNGENVSKTHEFEVLEGEEGLQGEHDGQVDYSQDVGNLENALVAEPLNACFVEEGQMHWNDVDEGTLDRGEEEEQMQWDAPEATVFSTRDAADTAAKVPEMSDSDTETLVMCQKQAKQNHKEAAQPQNVDSPKESPSQSQANSKKKSGNQNKQVSPSKMRRQPQESANKFTKLKFSNERRKRLLWRPEEEEMLGQVVQKFSTTENKNLPWRKILEFGRQVFDATRTPTDLKDKWRNIMAKESSVTNGRFS